MGWRGGGLIHPRDRRTLAPHNSSRRVRLVWRIADRTLQELVYLSLEPNYHPPPARPVLLTSRLRLIWGWRRLDWGEKTRPLVSAIAYYIYRESSSPSVPSSSRMSSGGFSTAGLNQSVVGGELAFDFCVPSTLFFACR